MFRKKYKVVVLAIVLGVLLNACSKRQAVTEEYNTISDLAYSEKCKIEPIIYIEEKTGFVPYIVLTNDYNGYENIDSSISMEIVIDVSVIETVSWFDFGAYESVNNSLISTDTDSADDIENNKSPDETTILSIGKFSLKRKNIF